PVAGGHLETPYLGHGATEADARRTIERMLLNDVKAELDKLIGDADNTRPWYDVARDEDGE
ncbi:MAG: hypothetical protein M3Z17_07475, partial [Gemmatimonadota bacterium]|nr:hypothetical protein [Gemmatimonadota bacterium]